MEAGLKERKKKIIGNLGKRRKYCIPPTTPPPRVHKLAAATHYPRVRFIEATDPTPRVETSVTRAETSDPHKADAPEPIE